MKPLLLLLAFCAATLIANSQSTEDRLNKMHSELAELKGQMDSNYVRKLMHIGAHHANLGNLDSAQYYIITSRDLAIKIKHKFWQVSATIGLGDLYSNWAHYDSVPGDWDRKALAEYLAAEKMIDEVRPGIRRKIKATIDRSIAMVYLNLDDREGAFKYLKSAEAYFVGSTDTITTLNLYNHFIFYYDKDTLNSFRYLKAGLALCDVYEKNHPGDEYNQTRVNVQRMHMISHALTEDSAASMNKPSLAILETIWNRDSSLMEDGYEKCLLLTTLSGLYRFTGQYSKSIVMANMAMERFPEDAELLKQQLYDNLAISYAGVGNYKEAYDKHVLGSIEYEKSHKQERFDAVAGLQAKYESEKKEQQIASLQKERKAQRNIMLVSIGALVIAVGFLLFVLRANRLQRKLFAREKELQKNEMEKRMFELEQTALRAQMNPHFIFNSLNSVQRYVINNDPEGVNMYLSTFANLIRQTLENSGKQLIPLKDEVRYLETYLRLEQMRGNEKFRFRINVTPDIDTEETYIPNMIIQPFLENSIIHGMAGKKNQEGMIDLNISRNGKLTCVVEDNGIGLKISRQQKLAVDSDHESMGSAITQKRIDMFNTMNNEKIELEMVDKSELGSSESGTRILIKFPLTSHN